MGTVTRLADRRVPQTRPDLTITFDLGHEGEWLSLRAAEKFLDEREFSYGPQQGGNPIGVMFGEVRIAKWTNLDPEDKDNLHGVMTAALGDFRRGAVTIAIRPDAPSAVIEAFRSTPLLVVTSEPIGASFADAHPVIDPPGIFADNAADRKLRHHRMTNGFDLAAQRAIEKGKRP